jgi:hypothetical protein
VDRLERVNGKKFKDHEDLAKLFERIRSGRLSTDERKRAAKCGPGFYARVVTGWQLPNVFGRLLREIHSHVQIRGFVRKVFKKRWPFARIREPHSSETTADESVPSGGGGTQDPSDFVDLHHMVVLDLFYLILLNIRDWLARPRHGKGWFPIWGSLPVRINRIFNVLVGLPSGSGQAYTIADREWRSLDSILKRAVKEKTPGAKLLEDVRWWIEDVAIVYGIHARDATIAGVVKRLNTQGLSELVSSTQIGQSFDDALPRGAREKKRRGPVIQAFDEATTGESRESPLPVDEAERQRENEKLRNDLAEVVADRIDEKLLRILKQEPNLLCAQDQRLEEAYERLSAKLGIPVPEIKERIERIRSQLRQRGHYEW